MTCHRRAFSLREVHARRWSSLLQVLDTYLRTPIFCWAGFCITSKDPKFLELFDGAPQPSATHKPILFEIECREAYLLQPYVWMRTHLQNRLRLSRGGKGRVRLRAGPKAVTCGWNSVVEHSSLRGHKTFSGRGPMQQLEGRLQAGGNHHPHTLTAFPLHVARPPLGRCCSCSIHRFPPLLRPLKFHLPPL